MSIHKREYRDASGKVYKTRYRVRWNVRDVRGNRGSRSREFRTQTEARDFEAQIRLELSPGREARRTGRAASVVTLNHLWADYVAIKTKNGDLERTTISGYDSIWRNHLADPLGDVTLGECNGTTFARDRLTGSFRQRGTVSVATQRKAFDVLSSLLTYAQDYAMITSHQSRPKRGSLNVRASRQASVMISIRDIELMRVAMMDRTAGSSLGYTAQEVNTRDALLLTLIGYAGLRPAECLGLQVGDIRIEDGAAETSITIQRQVVEGVAKPVKNARSAGQAALRTIDRLPTPLIQDLRAWLGSLHRHGATDFLFHQAEGTPWTKTNYRNWRKAFDCALDRVVASVGSESLADAIPYDLRTSLCVTYSLVGVDPLTAARRSGHTTAVAYDYYVTAEQNPNALHLDSITSWQDWCLAVSRCRLQAGSAARAS